MVNNIRQFFISTFKNNELVFGILLAIVVLLSVFFIPTLFLSSAFVKTFILTLGVVALLVAVVVRALKTTEISFASSPVSLGIIILFIALCLSTVLSDSVLSSFVTYGVGANTFIGLVSCLVLGYLTIICFSNEAVRARRLFILYVVFGVIGFVLSIAQILLGSFGGQLLSFFPGVQVLAYLTNTIGSVGDLGIYYGVLLLLSVVSLEMLLLNRLFKVTLYVLGVCSVLFLVLINFTPTNIALAAVLWILFFYQVLFLYRKQNKLVVSDNWGDSGAVKPQRKFAIKTLIVALVVTFLSLPIGFRMSNSIATKLNVGNFEVRPSWDVTYEIFRNTISTHSFFGVGLNQFYTQWQLHRPIDVMKTPFWNTNFEAGVGLLPTLFVEMGLVGVFAWGIFILLVLYVAARALFVRTSDPLTQFFVVTSSVLTLFLWAMVVIYPVGIVILAFSFLFMGILVVAASMVGVGQIKVFKWQIKSKTHIAALALSGVIFLTCAWLFYGAVTKTLSTYYFQKGNNLVLSVGNLADGEKYMNRALMFSKSDTIYRALAGLHILKMQSMLNSAYGRETVSDEEKLAFKQAIESAEAFAKNAIEWDRNNYQNNVVLGRVYESLIPVGVQGAYEAAMLQLEQALKQSPRNPELVLEIARTEVAKNNLDKAKNRIGQVLELKPDYIDAIFLLAQIDVLGGNLAGAIRSVEQIVALSPGDPLAHFRHGLLQYEAKNYRKAADSFQKSISLVPVYANAQYFLGLSLYEIGKTKEAIQMFESIDKTNPGNIEIGNILQNLRAGKDPLAGSEPTDLEDREDLPVDEE